MFFCSECNSKYDITKNIEAITSRQLSRDDTTVKNSVYFICNNCGYHTEIIPETMIYSKTTDKPVLLSQKNKDLIYDNTLPITKKYICVNTKCETHSNPKNKEAIFYKNNNNILTYICKVCSTDWEI